MFFLEIDLGYPYNIRQKTKQFPFGPKIKTISKNDFNDYINQIEPKNHVFHKTLLCDWTDQKNYLIQYRMLKFYVRHGMVVDKVLHMILFKQSKWLEK